MTHILHSTAEGTIVEITDPDLVLHDGAQFLEMAMNLPASQFILRQHHLNARFFDLSTGVAGDILQKVSNYRLRLAIVGDFSARESTSLRHFIVESNKGKTVAFVNTVDEAIAWLQI